MYSSQSVSLSHSPRPQSSDNIDMYESANSSIINPPPPPSYLYDSITYPNRGHTRVPYKDPAVREHEIREYEKKKLQRWILEQQMAERQENRLKLKNSNRNNDVLKEVPLIHPHVQEREASASLNNIDIPLGVEKFSASVQSPPNTKHIQEDGKDRYLNNAVETCRELSMLLRDSNQRLQEIRQENDHLRRENLELREENTAIKTMLVERMQRTMDMTKATIDSFEASPLEVEKKNPDRASPSMNAWKELEISAQEEKSLSCKSDFYDDEVSMIIEKNFEEIDNSPVNYLKVESKSVPPINVSSVKVPSIKIPSIKVPSIKVPSPRITSRGYYDFQQPPAFDQTRNHRIEEEEDLGVISVDEEQLRKLVKPEAISTFSKSMRSQESKGFQVNHISPEEQKAMLKMLQEMELTQSDEDYDE